MYEVLYTPLQTFGGAIESEAMTLMDRNITLTGLQEYVEYNISVRAYTSVGAGPYTDGVVERTFEDGTHKTIVYIMNYLYALMQFLPVLPPISQQLLSPPLQSWSSGT